MATPPRVLHFVFDGPPAPDGPYLVEIRDDQGRSTTLPPGGPRLVEVEDQEGHSVRVGDWIDIGDGYWALRIVCPPDRASSQQPQARGRS